jgi:cytochrome oxidase Cu insertion factor (SCO1/SenC/PrrC family)
MARRPAALAWLVLAAACATIATGCSRPPSTGPDNDPGWDVGDFTLTERGGQSVSRSDLLGKVWVASFVFTRCTGPCPQVTGTMARLQGELADQSDVVLVTFTVDPERDDPEQLSRYASHFGADPQRWLFLTGKEADIYRLLREGFRVPVDKNGGGENIGHSSRLAVVDRRGLVRGFFQGVREPLEADPEQAFEADHRRLLAKVAALLREQP